VLRGLSVVAFALSIDTAPAHSQGSAGSAGVGSGSAEASDDEENGSAAGSAKVLVAPADPNLRLAWLRGRLDGAIASRPLLGAKARITASIVDVETGKEIYARDANQAMSLASNAKLLTSVAALGTLGGGFHWRTTVFIDDKALDEITGNVKGDLYIRGRGDPTLTIADLRELATEIAGRGIRTIEGNLVVDTSYFDKDVEPPHYNEQPKERAYFRAPVASFGVGRSSFLVNVIGNPDGTAKVWLEPSAGDILKLTKVEVTSIIEGRTRLKLDIKPKKEVLEIEVTGQIKLADGHWWSRRRIDDPSRFAAEVFREALRDRGITIGKKIKFGGIPLTAKPIVVHDSAPLSSIVREMNKTSDNYFAECVLKTMGAETRATPAPATWADGQAAVRAYLAKIGLPPGTYRIDNGSGLFNATEVSAKQLVTLLRAAHSDYRIGPDLLGSLPVGGMDGTLAKRWQGTPVAGRVRAKTGTLAAARTLAGYVAIDSARPLAFAILINDIPPGQKPASRAMADDMLETIVAYLEASTKR